ncbi:MAG: DUF1015 domain-containing protein [Sandaracinus sp.]|nr:DUF1015 domain-containing protein [Sandaracinus sp.]MCB9633393.1 DUF1015 domain-containing protein [Sandaracinus sp.]
MVAVAGLVGLRPAPAHVAEVSCPPYDVVKEGSPLWKRLFANPRSMVHVTLGDTPADAIARLQDEGFVVRDDEPSFYVYEQRWMRGDQAESRTGVFVAVEVKDYSAREIIRHEKTFDDKVRGRVQLAKDTAHNTGPVFLLTKSPLAELFERAKQEAPLYDFASDFGGGTDLHGVKSRVWKVVADSELGRAMSERLAPQSLYIADGHHRYHAALKGGQTHALAYVTDGARILAYDRVVNGLRPFAEIRDALDLEPADAFTTPDKHTFRLYTKDGCWTLRAKDVPSDVVGRLDCSILERELYPHLALEHRHIPDPKHFDYYPESALDEMKAAVDDGRYELAIALHPVAIDELIAVADAGLEDSSIVMPEKSTFFAPKILTGLIVYRHTYR